MEKPSNRPCEVAGGLEKEAKSPIMEIGSELPAKWVVLLNPMAGAKKGRADWANICSLLDQYGISYQDHTTEYRRHSIELVQKYLAEGFHNFIVAGGDGLLNEAVNAIFSQALVDPKTVTLAVIPLGTGNDWARTFGIPSDFEGAIKIIRNGRTLRHDVGRVFYHALEQEKFWYFINMCGAGFDAEVNKKATSDREKGLLGPMKYRYHVFSELMGYSPTKMAIIIDGKQIRQEVFSIAVGICKYNGGGMKQLPYAVPDDGVMDVTLIQKITRLKVIRSVHKLYDGSFVELPEVSSFTGKSIQIKSDPKCWIEADGEALGESPFRFEIFLQALNVVIP